MNRMEVMSTVDAMEKGSLSLFSHLLLFLVRHVRTGIHTYHAV